jgi:hypothetical protein
MFRKRVLYGLVLLLIPAASAFGQAGRQQAMGFNAFGGHLGWVDPEDLDSTPELGVQADFGPMIPDLHLEGNIDLWWESQTFPAVKESFRDLSLGAAAKYYPPLPSSYFKPFVGGGIALHFFHKKHQYHQPIDVYGTTSLSDNHTELGLDLAGGTLYSVSDKVDLLGEFRYRIVSDIDPFLDISHIALRAGIMYNFVQ